MGKLMYLQKPRKDRISIGYEIVLLLVAAGILIR